MQSLPEEQYPKDFYYHRTSADAYRAYLKAGRLETFQIPGTLQFAWVKRFFGNTLSVLKYERTDVEPNVDWIRSNLGVKHGCIIWIPYSIMPSASWRKLFLSDHFQETGYAVLPKKGEPSKIDPPYLTSWHERPRRARKKWLLSGGVIRRVDSDIFTEAFRTTKVKGPHKGGSIAYYKKLKQVAPDSIREWLTYDADGHILGGLAVMDYRDHSVHLVAFTNRKYYAMQAGTGLIDEWFRDSHDMGMRYLSFDHIRNPDGPRGQKGYSEFKEGFLTARLSFPYAYFRFF